MGEIPMISSRMPFPYPKASKAVLGTLAKIMGVTIVHNPLEEVTVQMETVEQYVLVRQRQHELPVDVVVHAASHTNEKGQASGLQDLRLFRNGQMVGYLEGALKDGHSHLP